MRVSLHPNLCEFPVPLLKTLPLNQNEKKPTNQSSPPPSPVVTLHPEGRLGQVVGQGSIITGGDHHCCHQPHQLGQSSHFLDLSRSQPNRSDGRSRTGSRCLHPSRSLHARPLPPYLPPAQLPPLPLLPLCANSQQPDCRVK